MPRTGVGGVVKTCDSEPAPITAMIGILSQGGTLLSSFQVRQPLAAMPASNDQSL